MLEFLRGVFGLKAVATALPALTLSQRVMKYCMCPVCLQTNSLLQGPCGGMSVNVMCSCCGTRLNLTPMLGRVEWTHGPQGSIWNDEPQSFFPTDEQIQKAKEGLSA